MSEPTVPSLLDRITSLLRFSIAAQVAIAVGLSLLLLTLMSWMLFSAAPQRVAWGDYLQWPQLAMLSVLWLLICAVTYWTVRFWMEDVPPREQELDKAWRAGLTAIAKRGISIQEQPFFLVLGCKDELKQNQFVKNSQLKLLMEPIPSNQESPIRWFLGEDRILLFCSEVGTFGETQSRLNVHRHLAQEADVLSFERSQTTIETYARGSEVPMPMNQEEQDEVETPAYFRNTSEHGREFLLGSHQRDRSNVSLGTVRTIQHNLPSKAAATTASINEVFESLDAAERLVGSWHEEGESPSSEIRKRFNQNRPKTQLLSSTEVVRGQTLLEDLCRQIQVARSGVAPINGILAWVDSQPMMDCVGFASQSGQALRRDQSQIQEHFGLLAPTAIVFDRMHEVSGFTELVRRSGPEKAIQSTLGEVMDVTEVPDSQSIQQLCQRAIGSIQSTIYQNLRPRQAHNQPANHKLFKLLLASRARLHETLETLLLSAFAYDRSSKTEVDPDLVSGVFFTASGSSPVEQAFGKSVMDRMIADQELLSWTTGHQKLEAKLNGIAWNLKAVSAVLVLTIALQLISAIIR